MERSVEPMQELNETPLTREEIQSLEKHYEIAARRMLHEYDQRDREFVMYLGVHGVLLIVAGLIIHYFEFNRINTWIAAGLMMTIVGCLGRSAGWALQDSVESFQFWQRNLNVHLAQLELSILPNARFGTFCQIVARSVNLSNIHPDKNTCEQLEKLRALVPKEDQPPYFWVNHRDRLAVTLKRVWMLALILGLLLFASGIMLMLGQNLPSSIF